MDRISALLISSLPSIILALATAFFTSRFYAHQMRAELQKEFESRFNERKWEVYTGFADIVREVIRSGKSDRLQRDLPKLIDKLLQFTSGLWIVGSDEVVEAFTEWQRYSRSVEGKETNPLEGLAKLTDILIEMRKDLGYKSSKIRSEDLLATFITDVDKYLL